MKQKQIDLSIPDISPIIETYDKDGCGYLGFTVYYRDGSFHNVMRSFSTENRNEILTEITHLRELKLSIFK